MREPIPIRGLDYGPPASSTLRTIDPKSAEGKAVVAALEADLKRQKGRLTEAAREAAAQEYEAIRRGAHLRYFPRSSSSE